MSENKKTCYQCKFRRSVPGNAHIMCGYNWSESIADMPKGEEQGIKNGWWVFPWLYDPTWMIGECVKFE